MTVTSWGTIDTVPATSWYGAGVIELLERHSRRWRGQSCIFRTQNKHTLGSRLKSKCQTRKAVPFQDVVRCSTRLSGTDYTTSSSGGNTKCKGSWRSSWCKSRVVIVIPLVQMHHLIYVPERRERRHPYPSSACFRTAHTSRP